VKDTAVPGPSQQNGEGFATDVTTACTAIKRSYPSILQGLDKLYANNEPTHDSRAATAEIVHLFQHILGQLHASRIEEVATRSEAQAPKTKTKGQRARAANSEQLYQQLAKLLTEMIDSLDLSKVGQCRLLEGLICSFFDHLGSLLSLVVFADNESASTGSALLGILPPQGLLDTVAVDRTIALKAVHLEAPYLVYLLKRTMLFLNAHVGAPTSTMSHLFSLARPGNLRDEAYLQKIKEKLQNTLLRAVFGEEDKTFRNGLRRANSVEDVELQAISGLVQSDEKSSDWFVGEVWEHLGWEILSGEM